MGDEPDYLLLDRYFAGECTPAEDALLQRWIAERADRRTWVEDLRAMRSGIHLAPIPTPVVDVDAEWAAFATEATRSGQRDAPGRVAALWSIPRDSPKLGTAPHAWPQGVGGGQTSWMRWMSSAAPGAVIAVAVGVVSWQAATRRAAPQALREFTTPAGGRAAVTLRDGTRLVLGPASRVRVPNDFGTYNRTVELSGEALFTVVHDARHPFAVRTPATTVRDVGTVFAVRAYANDTREQVAVQEGSVSIGAVTLHARDVATVTGTHVIAVRTVSDIAPYLAWSQGRLAFSDTPLRDVARELGRTFDVTITVTDSALAGTPVTGSFTDQPVEVILGDITAVLGAQFQRAGRVITIRPRAGGAMRPDRGTRVPLQTLSTADPHA